MARYIGPVCRFCRREGKKLYIKGERCYTDKCSVVRRKYAPGESGQVTKRKKSDYFLQLREKQKVKEIYGVLEKQFRGYFERAARQKGVTGETLLSMLERRLDNVVYRLGLAMSRRSARQLVSHEYFLVNGKKVNIPSYLLKVNDVIEVRKDKNPKRLNIIKNSLEKRSSRGTPRWLEFDATKLSAKVIDLPRRDDIECELYDLHEQLIVELYSK